MFVDVTPYTKNTQLAVHTTEFFISVEVTEYQASMYKKYSNTIQLLDIKFWHQRAERCHKTSNHIFHNWQTTLVERPWL